MGLEIYAYWRILDLEREIDPDAPEKIARVYVNPSFVPQADGLHTGMYRADGHLYFDAGSYCEYNEWRGELAKLIGKTDMEIWANPAPGPFVELINFTDCDGVIGAATAKKLYQDFADHLQEAVNRYLCPDCEECEPWFIDMYRDFMRAFEIASDRGCVIFS